MLDMAVALSWLTWWERVQVKRYREAELTHGRVCMLASVGMLTGEAAEPSAPFFDAQITGPAIVHFQQVPAPFWEYVVFGIALAEAYRVSVGWANPAEKGAFVLKENYEPGQIGYAPNTIPSTY